MRILKGLFKLFIILFMIIFGLLLILKPQICTFAVANAVILCGRVLIPSLFPFSVCMLYIMKSDITNKLQKFLPLNIIIMIFSMLGGFPIGAKLINEAVSSGQLTPKSGRKMLNYCVNAGPGFIVSAVGSGLFHNKALGFVFLISHILSSLIIAIIEGKIKVVAPQKGKHISVAESFVQSASDSAGAILSICNFVILFSVITSYIELFAVEYKILKPLLYLCEVTTAIGKTRNIYLISFLLGFSGISIWCQVFSLGKAIRINILQFAFFRLLHGAISVTLTYLVLKIYPVKLPTFSNIDSVITKPFVSTAALGVSLLILGVIFVISLSTRQKNTKILDELI